MAEFLLELFSEEIPARMQKKAASDLARLVADKLKDAGLSYDKATPYVTVRRLVLHIEGLDTEQPDVREERRGPRADAPEKAIEGFLKGAGVTRDQVEIREEKKGTFLYAVIERKGRKTSDVIAEFLPEVIRNFPWPKSQRWGAKSLRWVRPLHSILCLLDGEIVSLDLGNGLKSSNMTQGHRFLSPATFKVASFEEYEDRLKQSYVILDAAKRKTLISEKAHALAEEAGLVLLEDEGLSEEVTGLAEYPVVLMGQFDKEFLEVPSEALTSAMKSHQKYFSVLDASGKLTHKFIFVSNMKTDDQGAKIIAGNERVLRARLADTKFFWDQDLKITLDDRLPALDGIIYHNKLGSLGWRVKRCIELSGIIAEKIGADVDQAKRAAQLCKADLVSGMVGEFADLQGLIGKYYAEDQKELAAVANAIAEHYSPKGPSDTCPSESVSIAVALGEKLDTLVSFFRIDEKPTGSKDPFALRRAALGVIRLIVENKLRVNLFELIEKSHRLNTDTHAKQNPGGVSAFGVEQVKKDLLDFFADRLKVHLKSQGVRHDLITAVFALSGEDDLVRLLARVDALQKLLETEDGVNLLAGYKRAVNILRIEEKKDKASYDGAVDEDLLCLKEEKDLFGQLNIVSGEAGTALEAEDFGLAMSKLAILRPSIDAFFDQVTVNSEDAGERKNRLRLLSQIRTTMNRVADFSKIEG